MNLPGLWTEEMLMKLQYTMTMSLCFLMLATLNGCSNKEQAAAPEPQSAEQIAMEVAATPAEPTQLPVRYQNPGYVVATETGDDQEGLQEEQYALKVGANITSTKGSQPLWDIVKRLGNLKGMSVSWASDVDQSLMVDVNIKAEDNFFEALDNLLRQVDYFHVVEDNTIIIKYRETKRFFISLPNMKGTYTSTVGGNYLTDRNAASGTEGTVKITSDDNTFDIWQNIIDNLDIIMQAWTTVAETTTATDSDAELASGKTVAEERATTASTRQRSQSGSYYILDKSVGLITITAPRPILEKVGFYLKNLKKELYRQVIIEAKIIEVYLSDNSKIGLDWSAVLKDFSLSGLVEFGTGGFLGQVYPQIQDGDGDVIPFVSKVSMGAASFSVMLNALNEQGDAKVLSNPKLTVMNGQPALISVGKDIAYIKTVSQNINDSATGPSTVTYTAEVDNVVEGVAMGVVASIIDDDSVVLHLTPITTELIPVDGQEIYYRTIGDQALEIGLPKVGVREMSTMVKVNNGEMLIIGGLIDSLEGGSEKFAPILGNIPIIKYLFGVEEKRMEKRELVILLTPRVI